MASRIAQVSTKDNKMCCLGHVEKLRIRAFTDCEAEMR